MSQVDKSGRVTEHIKRRRRKKKPVCLLARQQPHRNIPVGASQSSPAIVCPDGATPVKNARKYRAKAQNVVFQVGKSLKKINK